MPVVSQPLAIPIPRPAVPKLSASTTPSLQSVLDQKRHTLSYQSMRWSVSSVSDDSEDIATSASTSLQSILSLESYEPCTHSHPLDDAPSDYLTDIDNDFFNDTGMLELVKPLPAESPLSCSSPSKAVVKKPSFVSQLSRSLRSFATSTKKQTNELVFDIQPRLTDDRLPVTHKHIHQQHDDASQDRELETFKVTSLSHSPSSTPLPSSTAVYRNREPRINSQFLRLYSHESASRQKGLLPEIAPEEEEIYMSNPNFYRGTTREFALLVRQRLWNCVVLPPREDALMDPVAQNDEYVFDGDDDDDLTITTTHSNDTNDNDNNRVHSLVGIHRQVKPWITLEDETEKNTRLGPRGVLAKGVQFTVKGWCNTRWMPSKV